MGWSRRPLSEISCKKNPGHPSFIPIDDFKIQDLPVEYQDQLLVDYINCTAELTAFIGVSYVSEGRPETWPGTDIPYPQASARGSNRCRKGTGFVCGVSDKFHTAKDGESCPCGKCKKSKTPSVTWGEFVVLTAGFLVVDNVEAQTSELVLFYRSPQSQAKVTYGANVKNIDIPDDWCMVTCVTHDSNLFNQLQETRRRWSDINDAVNQKYKHYKKPGLVVIVSHPHGCSQQVTVGRYRDNQEEKGRPGCYRLAYTTDTCPGSSGAALICPGSGLTKFTRYLTHSQGGKDYNRSTIFKSVSDVETNHLSDTPTQSSPVADGVEDKSPTPSGGGDVTNLNQVSLTGQNTSFGVDKVSIDNSANISLGNMIVNNFNYKEVPSSHNATDNKRPQEINKIKTVHLQSSLKPLHSPKTVVVKTRGKNEVKATKDEIKAILIKNTFLKESDISEFYRYKNPGRWYMKLQKSDHYDKLHGRTIQDKEVNYEIDLEHLDQERHRVEFSWVPPNETNDWLAEVVKSAMGDEYPQIKGSQKSGDIRIAMIDREIAERLPNAIHLKYENNQTHELAIQVHGRCNEASLENNDVPDAAKLRGGKRRLAEGDIEEKGKKERK